MPYFQIEVSYHITDKSYIYFECDEGEEQTRACEKVEEENVPPSNIMVREYNPSARKRVKGGREFGIRLRRVQTRLSTGRIISEQWYEPLRWD